MKPGWEVKALGEVCNFVRGPFGGSLKKEIFVEAGYAVYEQQHAIYDQFDDVRYFVDQAKFEEMKRFELKPNDLIMSCSGTMGKVAIVPEGVHRGIINQALLKLTATNKLDVFYLRYWMASPDFEEQLEKLSLGAAIKNVASVQNLKQISIPLPPLEEQKRIVAVLDAAFEGLSHARAHTETNLQNARELFESGLKQEFQERNEKWVSAKLGAICTKIGSGATPKGGAESYTTEGISLIRSLNVHDRDFRFEKLAFINEIQAGNLSNVVVEPNDVLLNITGASVARCCRVPTEILPARVNQHVSILRPKPEILDPAFLCYELTSEIFKDLLLATGEEGGATRQAITKAQLIELQVSFPASLEEQNQIVQKLFGLEQQAKQLQAHYRAKLADLDALRQALLQKAFAGELT